MSASGYAKANTVMYWRMYAGHNCTNYAAYRMVRSGMPNIRPWSGDGNATNWGTSVPTITNGTPAVGAVAWWKAYVSPAGSAGHVAYVEKVISSNEIIVSQDSWGGDFSWARITRSGSGWPSGFIHFNDVKLLNSTPPSISGTAKVGSTLTASSGVWSQPAATLAYQWQANGTNITGATTPTLVLGQAQQDATITVRVTASKLGYPTTSVTSAPTAAVLPGEISNVAAPSVSGVATVDATLKASPGRWYPAPDRLVYRWWADGTRIVGATSRTLTMDPALVGKTVSVAVRATKSGYTTVRALSAPTQPVAPGTLTVTSQASISGEPRPGQTITLTEPQAQPAATVNVQWLRGGVPVPGATGTTYQTSDADLGSRIAARVVLERPGYTSVRQRSNSTWRVRTTPRFSVTTEPGTGRLKVTVSVSARGVSPVSGTVRIRSRGRVLAQVPVTNGVATARFTGLPSGSSNFRFRFLTTRSLETVTIDRVVAIG